MTDRENKSEPNNQPGKVDTDEEGSLFEKVPEGIKRGFENLIRESRLKNIVGDLKLPKEVISHIMSQVDETKQAALGVIGREVRVFLENTNISEELAKLLTQISFEVKTQVRFVPNDKKLVKVKHSVSRKSKAPKSPPKDAPEQSEEQNEDPQ